VLLAITSLISFSAAQNATSYLGFDRNEYPGDATLRTLRQTFYYTGYWLNNPPGEKTNTWTGHRATVESAGLGFLVLFNGRLYADLKSVARAAKLGTADAAEATRVARREGFPAHAIIFLDQEQGGRMLPEQKAYIYAWADGVAAAGFRAGIYCSGVPAADDGNVVTAEDIRANAGSAVAGESAGKGARAAHAREITYWVTNDACPPAPGCSFPVHPPSPAESGVSFADVWQFAQSPRDQNALRCTNYNRDGDCYAPGIAAEQRMHLDVNTATSADPSRGRSQSTNR